MATHEHIYRNQADTYEFMISRQPELAEVIKEIRPFQDLDILDLGAGSGRLSRVLAEEAKSLLCTDISSAMLDLLEHKLMQLGIARNWSTVVADHRSLPIADKSIDLAVSGWSICYLTGSENNQWEDNLRQIISELHRVLRPDGTIIIFETMGTGTETPNPPEFLTDYYRALEEVHGFHHKWIRMDYHFRNVEEARQSTEFFFGEELAKKIIDNHWSTVPECAGIWWKHL
ncbi:class I SAM-dependent methyltransferase [Paenibacillus motobuensis]|uniref:Methyltransferase type 11 domain-containing protein n=1 Tax=Paenibacillus motobuensis TaxID=295324 RepID=A0ABP3HZB3_9BACL